MLAGKPNTSKTPTLAWTNGTNIRTAMRLQPGAVSVWLAGRIAQTCQLVDAGTTIRDDSELTLVVDALVEEFPAMKLEEWDILLTEVARGKFKLFNRLKLPEFMECARDWENRRCEILERLHRPEHDPFRRASDGVPKRVALMLTPADMAILDHATGVRKKGGTESVDSEN